MVNIKEIDDKLYVALFIKKNSDDSAKIWSEIKDSEEILREAIKVTKNKYGEDTLVGTAICNCMLLDYSKVDENIYKELVNTIYSNQRIARLVLDGYSNGGNSFLLMTLWNHNLKLTEEQKAFAVSEAMNKIGTTKSLKQDEEYSKKLDEQGITNKMTAIIGFGREANPIGEKAGCEYMHFMFQSMDDSQAHGIGAFDIRFQILRNPNWTIEEKKILINEFYHDDETYEDYLDEWCWEIINHNLYREGYSFVLENWYLFDYTYDDILDLSQSREIADEVWQEINFCKMIEKLRMPSWKKEPESLKRIIER